VLPPCSSIAPNPTKVQHYTRLASDTLGAGSFGEKKDEQLKKEKNDVAIKPCENSPQY
jgi:hypothetical protein